MKMSKNFLAAGMLTLAGWMGMAAQGVAQTERTVGTVMEHPQFGVASWSSNNLAIDKVELLPEATRLHMTIFHSPTSWARIVPETYIRVKGEKLPLTSAEGIVPGKEFYSDSTNQTHFVLNFPAVAANAQTLDFIEGDGEGAFRIWEVALTPEAQAANQPETPAEVKAWAELPDDGQPLVTPEWKSGKAVVKGTIRGYKPEMGRDVAFYYDNPVAGGQNMGSGTIADDGTFRVEVPVVTSDATVGGQIRGLRLAFLTVVSVGKETEVYIDLPAKSHHETDHKELNMEQEQYLFFRGAHADLNNALHSPEGKRLVVNAFHGSKEILNLSLEEYKALHMAFCDKQVKKLEESSLPLKAKEYQRLRVQASVRYYLSMAKHFLEMAFREEHKLGTNDEMVGFNQPVYTKEYFSYWRELEMDNPKAVIVPNYSWNINECNFIVQKYYGDNYLNLVITKSVNELLKDKSLDKKARKTLKEFGKITTAEELMAARQLDTLLWDRLGMEGDKQVQICNREAICEILGNPNSQVPDLTTTQILCRPLDQKMLIPEESIREAEKLSHPFFAEYVKERNAELAAFIEGQKQKGGYTVHQAGESEGEALLVDIVSQFKGQVILIDVWATWCGPCRRAIDLFEPAKQALADKGVAFVYLTDQSSPEATWNNMIPDIKGAHFRLQDAQLRSLKQLFDFTGVPSYLIIDKTGKVVYAQTGFEGTERMKQRLEEELKK